MKTSIRKFLLINLLLAISITTTLTAIGNYYLDQKDIQEHLDTLMAVSALSYQALLGHDIYQRPLHSIQQNLNLIPQKIELYYQHRSLNELPPAHYLNKFNFQVWAKNHQLLLHSFNAPNTSLSTQKDGFSNKVIDDQSWRVFSAHNTTTGIRTVLAERYDTRNELSHRIAQDDLYIMLLTFPLSGLLIWIIIGRGLDSLDRVAKEVANRAPTHLEPVNLDKVPEEIKPVVDELNHLFFRLKEGFEREKRFAADAAHELRTPLAAIKAQAQVALNIENLEEKNVALHKLITSVNRSTHIVQQLLTMSKSVPEATTLNDIHQVDFIKITQEVLNTLTPHALEKHIDLTFEHTQEKIILEGNATVLSILVRNLIDNAIRYSDFKNSVIVRLFYLNNSVVFQVEDNGPGIPAELKDRVFERFFRILGSKTSGSGLGLSIVKQVAELHGGYVELNSPPKGHGLLVEVFFPRH